MRISLIGLICIATLGGMTSGCSTVDIREGAAPGVRVPERGIRLNTVVILDESLQKWDGKVFDPPWSKIFRFSSEEKRKYGKIAVEATNSRRTETGTLEAWATLRNRTSFPLQIEARTHFFDKTRAPLEGPTAWQRVHLAPKSVASYKERSTRVEGIGYYYIEVREGR